MISSCDDESKTIRKDSSPISSSAKSIQDFHFDKLHREILDYVKQVEPSFEEMALRTYMIRIIQIQIYSLYPQSDAVFSVFGSQYTGLALPQSDIDLVVHHRFLDPYTVLPQIHQALQYMTEEFLEFDLILTSRVPVLKFKSRMGMVKCDITVNNNDGPKSTNLVLEWTGAYPQLRPIALVVKAFLAKHSFDAVYTGGMGGFGLLNLIVSLLQQHPELCDSEPPLPLNLGRLLYQFFKIYGSDFAYDSLAISVRLGAYIPKPAEIVRTRYNTSYATNTATTTTISSSNDNLRLYIEDPTELTNNVCKSTFRMGEIKDSFNAIYRKIVQVINIPHKLDSTSSSSILGYIVNIDPVVTQQRTQLCLDWTFFSQSHVQQYSNNYHQRHESGGTNHHNRHKSTGGGDARFTGNATASHRQSRSKNRESGSGSDSSRKLPLSQKYRSMSSPGNRSNQHENKLKNEACSGDYEGKMRRHSSPETHHHHRRNRAELEGHGDEIAAAHHNNEGVDNKKGVDKNAVEVKKIAVGVVRASGTMATFAQIVRQSQSQETHVGGRR